MLTDNVSPIVESLVPNSDRLFVFFGGIRGALGMPHFEFYQAAEVLNSNKLFIRDLTQCWYQQGLPGLGDTPFAIGEYLADRIKEIGVSDVRFVGNSMGGFAALLFCSMLRIGKVVAFAPQTFVSKEKRKLYGDRRWAGQIRKMHDHDATGIYELKTWIQERFPEIPANVYVSSLDSLDMIHASELAEFANVVIHGFGDGGHGLVKSLRDKGVLAGILND